MTSLGLKVKTFSGTNATLIFPDTLTCKAVASALKGRRVGIVLPRKSIEKKLKGVREQVI
jgi:hypothetical protein